MPCFGVFFAGLEELVAHPPPRHELRLERWLAKRLERSTKRSRPHGGLGARDLCGARGAG